MDKRLRSIVILGLLVAAGLLGYITFKTEVVSGSVLYVGGGGPGNYTNIQDAIDAAIDGDTVYVYSGIYYEDVVVDKTINLTGENRDTTIIDGSGTLDIVSIVANWVNVSGFTVTNGDDDGIELHHVQNCRIFNNTVSSNNHWGIMLWDSNWNNITGNTASYNYVGIKFSNSSWNNVIGNDVSNNDYGISLSWSSWNNINDNIANSNREHGLLLSDSNNNTLINNNASSNDRAGIFLECSIENTLAGNTMIYNGIWIRGDGLEYWNTHDIDTSNTVNGKPVHYWKNRTGGIVPAGAGQVILANCTNVIVEGQDLSYGTISIELGFSSNNTIKDNNISSNNVDGIFICFSNGNTITNNNASSNRQSGFHLRGSNGNNIIRNNANSNYYGFMLGHSSGNNIIGNLVSNNRYGFYLYNDSNTNIITNNLVFSNINIGLLLVDSTGNNIIDNEILKNNWGITLDNSNKNNITNNNGFENTCGLYLDNSNENKVIGNNFSNNLLGILVNHFAEGNNIIGNTVSSNNESGIRIWGFSNGNNVIGNTFSSNNKYGIYLSESSGSNITSNAVLSNIGIGIYLFSSSNNNITNNYVSNNIIGFNLSSSSKNRIYHNNIDNNTNQAYDDRSDNYWDDGYPIGGNYWSDFDEPGEGAYDDFQGPNQDDPASGDGIVDKGIIAGGGKNPYVIDFDSQDNYPLINLVDTLPPIITNLQPPDGSTTNDNTPIISADYSDPSGINVSSVVLKVDGIDVTSSAVVTASGVTYLPITALPDGIHIVYLEVKDNVDNLAIAMWTFTVDTTPPTITNLQPPDASTTSDYTPMIGADYSDLSGIDVNSVLLEVDGIDVTLLATVTESTVSYIPGMALSEGIHTVYLEVRDNVGNLAIATWSFTVDTLPPIITNLQPPDGSTTNDNTPIISADYSDPSGIKVSSVILRVDGINVTSSAIVTASGVSYSPVGLLLDGIHTVYLEAMDSVSNLATASWTFTVDSTPPTITNLQPPDASTTNDNTSKISANYSDFSGINVSSVLLEVDGIDITSSAVVTVTGVSYIPGIALSDDIHIVYLEVKDNYGNLATATWNFTVDTLPPIITNLQPSDTSTTNDSTPLIAADYSDPSGINVSSVLLRVDGIDITTSSVVTENNVSYKPGTALSESSHTVYLEVKDIYGNLATAMWTFTVDTLPPTITNLQPPDASTTNDNPPIISADYSDPSGINLSTVVLEVDGIDVTLSATVTASGVSYTPGTILSQGVHIICLEVKDNIGNLATATWNFTVDTLPPIIINLQPPDLSTMNDSTPTISANYSDPSGINVSSVLLKVDGIDMTPSAMITATNIIYTPGTALPDGIRTVYLEVKDNIGNLATAMWTFTVDTTPPTTTINPDNHTVKLGTVFTLTATDGVAGCGVNYTQYKIDDGEWIDYLGPFSIDTYGYHNITYRSVDYLCIIENEKTLSIYVPMVPITTIIIGTPHYSTTPRYVNYSTQFSFSVIDYSGTGYNTYYYIDTSPLILYVEPFTVSTEGAHTIYYYSTDNLGNIENTKEFDIIVDNTPPTTNIAIGDPNYASGDTWVTSATEFKISTTDGGLIPAGINHTKYRIWNEVWSGWGIFQNDFTLGFGDGIRYVEFYSVDWLGNEEPIVNRTYFVDNTDPTTTISVGDPKYKGDLSDIWNVTSATTFALSVIEDGVGLNYTEYRIWDNGNWSDWYIYAEGFKLGSDNGTKCVEWLSVDNLGNKEMSHNETYFVDNIPPETNYLLLLEPDNTEARISLIPSDVGSGVDFTKYRINSEDWITYSDTFVINESGEHVIYFRSTDKLGNIEETKEFSVLVEEPGTTPPRDEEKEPNFKPLIALIFSIILLIVGSYVSYKRPLDIKWEISRNRRLTWLFIVLSFAIAEAITGIVSLLTGLLSIPPLFGVGMAIDLAILIAGLIAFVMVYRKQ